MSELTYRVIFREDIEQLQALHEREFGKRLPEGIAMASVAERDGVVVAFVVLQLAAHLEPMYTAPQERGRVWWPTLVKLLEAEMVPGTGYYVHASPDGSNIGMCEAVGMKSTGRVVYQKEI